MARQWATRGRVGDTRDIRTDVLGYGITMNPDGSEGAARLYKSTRTYLYHTLSGRTSSWAAQGEFRPMSNWTRSWYGINKGPNQVDRIDLRADPPYVNFREIDRHFLSASDIRTIFSSVGCQTNGRLDPTQLDRNRVSTEVMIKLGDRKMSLGEAILESRSALSTAVNVSSRIVRIALAARRGRWNAVRRELGLKGTHVPSSKRFADQWLEYQYGILPIINDATDAYRLFQSGLSRPQVLSAVRNFTRQQDRSGRAGSWNYVSSAKIRTSCKVYAQLSNQYVDSIQRLGLINPVELGWNVLPFSFVIDWFLPIGSVLEASTARAGLVFTDATLSGKSTWTSQVERIPPNSTTRYEYKSDVQFSLLGEAYKRTKLYSFPRPSLWIQSPFSMKKVITLLSLGRQLR